MRAGGGINNSQKAHMNTRATPQICLPPEPNAHKDHISRSGETLIPSLRSYIFIGHVGSRLIYVNAKLGILDIQTPRTLIQHVGKYVWPIRANISLVL